jgi:PAS domain-containing protein
MNCDRSKAEEALRASEERVNLAAEAANLGMWVWDLVRDEVWMTDKGRALLGLAPDTRLDSAALVARVHPEDRAAQDAAWAAPHWASCSGALRTGSAVDEQRTDSLQQHGADNWLAQVDTVGNPGRLLPHTVLVLRGNENRRPGLARRGEMVE